MITLAEAKTHLKVDHDFEDSLINGLIQAAYFNAEKRTRRAIREREETLTLDKLPKRSGAIKLPWNPVQEVVSFDYTDSTGVTESIDPLTLRLDTRELYPQLMPQYGTDWPDVIDEPESITIRAKVGYIETPPDIRQALLLIIGHLYAHRESIVIGVSVVDLPMGVDYLLGPHMIQRVG